MTNFSKRVLEMCYFYVSIPMGEARVFWKKARRSPFQLNSGGEAHDIIMLWSQQTERLTNNFKLYLRRM